MASKTKNASALWPGFFVGAMGALWLAQEIKWLPTSLPLGPLSIVGVSLALVYYFYPN